ncbi:maestro heat-like repeat-containing protein family member 6 [Aphelocoma coerulescens]|uniref:maestro heat-like repeat-containing protein family member 6 n=1 Tax=Aphelocoma coerulescens TaxID=39617 RepID=UPI003604C1A2
MSDPTNRGHLQLPFTLLQWYCFVSAQIKALETYFTPWEKTDIVLSAIEAMRDSEAFDHQAARNFLDVAMRSPELWLTDVLSIVQGIRACLEHTSPASDVQSLHTLLGVLARESPSELLCSMLTSVAPHDSTSLAMWDVMYSQNNIRSKFWTELQGSIHSQEQQDCELFSPTVLYAIRVYKVMLNPIDTEILELLQENKMSPKLECLSLLLAGLSTTLESPEKARRLQFLLPDVVEHLQHPDKAIRMKALRVFQNVVHHTESKEASSIAVQLSERLLPLFDDECSELRECSIHLFEHLLESLVGRDKKRMKKKARRGLVPLLLHMNEQTQSVAQVSRKALLAVAGILQWGELKKPIQAQHLWEIAELLLAKDRSKAEEYLQQSLPYLKDPQATMREAAIRFIAFLAVAMVDPECSIRCLADQTVLVLRVLSPQRRPRGILRMLCCH